MKGDKFGRVFNAQTEVKGAGQGKLTLMVRIPKQIKAAYRLEIGDIFLWSINLKAKIIEINVFPKGSFDPPSDKNKFRAALPKEPFKDASGAVMVVPGESVTAVFDRWIASDQKEALNFMKRYLHKKPKKNR